MIVIKNVPGLTMVDVMSTIADHVPLAEIQTGHGGVVVEERTALVFLQRYIAAVDGISETSPETEPEAEETVSTEPEAEEMVSIAETILDTMPKRRGRKPKEVW